MNDLAFWRALTTGRASDADLLEGFVWLHGLDAPARLPWLGFVAEHLSHCDPAVRVAAVRVFDRCETSAAWKLLLPTLADPDTGVQAVAAGVWHRITASDPPRRIHLLVHPDPRVRLAALERIREAGDFAPWMLFLLADPVCRGSVAGMVPGMARAPEELGMLLALARDGLVDPAQVARILVDSGWAAIVRLMTLPVRRDPEVCRRVLESLGEPDRPADIAPGSDTLDEVFDLIVAHRAAFPEAADAYLKSLPKHMAPSRTFPQADCDRLHVAVLRQFDRHDAEVPRFGQALAIGLAAFRDCAWIAIERRQEALLGLLLHDKPPKVSEKQLVSILRGPLVRTGTGLVHLRALAGLLRGAGSRPYNLMSKAIGQDEIKAAFDADPVGSVPFLTVRDASAGGQGMWIRFLLDRPGVPLVALVAELVHWLDSDQYGLFDWVPADTFREVSFATMLVPRPLNVNRSRQLADRVMRGWTLADSVGWLRQWEAIPAACTHPLALLIVMRVVRSSEPPADTVAALLSLEDRVLEAVLAVLPLLDLPADAAVIAGLEAGLTAHPSPKLAGWSAEQAQERQAKERAHAPPPDREAMLVGGVCDLHAAIAVPPHPSVPICVALLASSDPVAAIDREFARFGSDDPDFVRELDKEMIRHWRDTRRLSPLGHAVLYRWEQHFPWFVEDALALAGRDWPGLVELGSTLAAPLLRDRWFAAMQRQWQWWAFHDKPRLAATLNLNLALSLVNCLRDDLVAPRVVEVLIHHRDHWTRLGGWKQVLEAVVGFAPLLGEELRLKLAPLVDLTGIVASSVRRGIAPAVRIAASQVAETVPALIGRLLESESPADAAGAMRALVAKGKSAVDALAKAFVGDAVAIPHPEALSPALRLVPDLWLDGLAGLISRAGVRPDVRLLFGLTFAGVTVPDRVRRTLSLLASEPATGYPDSLYAGFFERVAGWGFQAKEAKLVYDWLAARTRGVGATIAAAEALLYAGSDDALEVLIDALNREGDFGLSSGHWERLVRLLPGSCAERLVVSPYPFVYHWSVEHLCKPLDASPALKTFLELGTKRMARTRANAARKLAVETPFDPDLIPLMVPDIFAGEFTAERILRDLGPVMLDRLTSGVLLAEKGEMGQAWVLALAQVAIEETRAAPLTRMLLESTSTMARRWARREFYGSRMKLRDAKLDRVAQAFAWGIRTGRMLTGEVFRIEMIADKQLGYTRLNENRVWISPVPILAQASQGEAVVRGLIVHELGHHMYHKGKPADAIWKQATEEKIHGLLNLVTDEHLERNLRVVRGEFGNDLKQLGSYAFMHSAKDVGILNLTRLLGGRTFAILSQSPLEVSSEGGCVQVVGGSLMHRMEKEGVSFVRFFRALRMGLGNRHDDPKVEAGLALFRVKGFKASTMAELWEITKRLREIFGSEVQLIESLGQCEGGMGTEGELDILGEGLTQEELDERVREILEGRKSKDEKGPPVRSINLSEDEAFNLITTIVPVPYDPEGAAKLTQSVAKPSHLLRKFLHNLGLRFVAQKMRLSGRQFDRSRTNALVLRGDPRVLIARQVQQQTDLFIGIVIDCSGSMAMHDRLEKAKRFGALIAEAVRGQSGIDTRFFGFTDAAIFDAGTAERCSVSGLHTGGGNNDAAALWHASQVARKSRRRAKLLVMISDGSPTECSVLALKGLVHRLSRGGFCCAQVAVAPIDHVCFPSYVLLEEGEIEASVQRFGQVMAKLVRRALGV